MDAPEETPDQAAQNIASLTQELAQIARRNGLDTLSHILEMARLEADQLSKRWKPLEQRHQSAAVALDAAGDFKLQQCHAHDARRSA
jgi:hypothetical protein